MSDLVTALREFHLASGDKLQMIYDDAEKQSAEARRELAIFKQGALARIEALEAELEWMTKRAISGEAVISNGRAAISQLEVDLETAKMERLVADHVDATGVADGRRRACVQLDRVTDHHDAAGVDAADGRAGDSDVSRLPGAATVDDRRGAAAGDHDVPSADRDVAARHGLAACRQQGAWLRAKNRFARRLDA